MTHCRLSTQPRRDSGKFVSVRRRSRREPQARRKQRGESEMYIRKYLGNAFLKVDDIKASGPIRVTITDVSEGRFGKPDLTFDDGTRLSCNVTNVRALARAYGMESDDWVDKEVELVVGEIKYDSKMNEAILVKPISPPIKSKSPPKHGDDMNDEIPF
jgi:hypothetical protein